MRHRRLKGNLEFNAIARFGASHPITDCITLCFFGTTQAESLIF